MLSTNFKPKRKAAASPGFLAIARLSCYRYHHISNTVGLQSCNYHIRSLRHIRPMIDRDVATVIACAIVSRRIDYCILFFIWRNRCKHYTPPATIQTQLTRVVCKAPYRNEATDLLRQLHWLSVTQRTDYKILTTVYVV